MVFSGPISCSMKIMKSVIWQNCLWQRQMIVWCENSENGSLICDAWIKAHYGGYRLLSCHGSLICVTWIKCIMMVMGQGYHHHVMVHWPVTWIKLIMVITDHCPVMVHRHVSHELNSSWWLWARVTIILSWFTDLCRRWNGSGRRRRCGGISWVISTLTWWRSSASTSRLSRISRRSAARTRSSSANYGPDNLSRPARCSGSQSRACRTSRTSTQAVL